MKYLLTRLTKKLTKKYLPEAVDIQEIWESPEYIKAIQYVEEAEKSKSLGMYKREYVQAHLKSWYQMKSRPVPNQNILNLMIELAVWRHKKWT